jgi:hypothetical protein
MAEEMERAGNGAASAVADAPRDEGAETPAVAVDERKRKKNGKGDEDLEYEVEFATPFGKLEFEFEPMSKKQKKDRDRKAKAERAVAKAAMALAKRAERVPRQGGGLSRLFVALLVIGLAGAAIAVAYWLFARPGDEEDVIPPEFANEPEPQPLSIVARVRGRVGRAVRAGRQASREAQREQREKFERMTGGR